MLQEEVERICQTHGSSLLAYEQGRFAHVALPSKEHIIVSIGHSTVKVFSPRRIVGFAIPRTVAAKAITDWHPEYHTRNDLAQAGSRMGILDGLVLQLSQCTSIHAVLELWPRLRNPLAVAFD